MAETDIKNKMARNITPLLVFAVISALYALYTKQNGNGEYAHDEGNVILVFVTVPSLILNFDQQVCEKRYYPGYGATAVCITLPPAPKVVTGIMSRCCRPGKMA